MILIIIILILIVFLAVILPSSREYFEGCRDFDGRLYIGTTPVCMNKEQRRCYSFYDSYGDLHAPCGMNEIGGYATKENCDGCSQHCQYCIDKNRRGTCISRQIFDCKLCPYSDMCLENPFDLNMKKKA
jgi:hypothetical protein